jgi:hypothetical protein
MCDQHLEGYTRVGRLRERLIEPRRERMERLDIRVYSKAQLEAVCLIQVMLR